MKLGRREKVFGPGRAVPLDRNAKVRIIAYARVWTARNKAPGQHKGPITRAFLDVLEALLWGFHNSRTGICFVSGIASSRLHSIDEATRQQRKIAPRQRLWNAGFHGGGARR